MTRFRRLCQLTALVSVFAFVACEDSGSTDLPVPAEGGSSTNATNSTSSGGQNCDDPCGNVISHANNCAESIVCQFNQWSGCGNACDVTSLVEQCAQVPCGNIQICIDNAVATCGVAG